MKNLQLTRVIGVRLKPVEIKELRAAAAREDRKLAPFLVLLIRDGLHARVKRGA